MAIKVDASLAAFLRALPNASDFIRSAVIQYARQSCPLCKGSGHVHHAVSAYLDDFVQAHQVVTCATCGAEEQLPDHVTPLDEPGLARWSRFAAGEPFRCAACFAATCPPAAPAAEGGASPARPGQADGSVSRIAAGGSRAEVGTTYNRYDP